MLGKSAGQADSKLAGGSGAPDNPCPSPAVAGLAAESSLVRGTEAGEIPLLVHTSLLCWGKQGWPSEFLGLSGS